MRCVVRSLILALACSPIRCCSNANDFHDTNEEAEVAIEQKFLKQIDIIHSPFMRIQEVTTNKSTEDMLQLDGIAHFRPVKMKANFTENAYEREFRHLLGMRGYSYAFKRNMHWFTWREVSYPNNSTALFFYRCHSVNGDDCGYWTIESKAPPCSYEILGVNNNDSLCVVQHSQLKSNYDSCPSLEDINDVMSQCNNPIKTVWRFTKTYDDPSNVENYSQVICGGRETCEIVTAYEINPDKIVFRIVNETGIIIYSKIMTKGDNYVCNTNCGVYANGVVTTKISNKKLLGSGKINVNYEGHIITNETKTTTTTTAAPESIKLYDFDYNYWNNTYHQQQHYNNIISDDSDTEIYDDYEDSN